MKHKQQTEFREIARDEAENLLADLVLYFLIVAIVISVVVGILHLVYTTIYYSGYDDGIKEGSNAEYNSLLKWSKILNQKFFKHQLGLYLKSLRKQV